MTKKSTNPVPRPRGSRKVITDPVKALTEAQKTMIADGAPAEIVTMTQAERNKVWEENPPKPVPSSFGTPVSAQDAAMRQAAAEAKKAQKKDREEKRKTTRRSASVDQGQPGPGMRWDPRRSKFVPENPFASRPETSTQPEEKEQEVMATKSKKKAAKKSNGAGKKKGPGVISTIIELMKRSNGATIPEMVERLKKDFPERKEKAMTATCRIQAAKNAKSKDKTEGRGLIYYA